MIVDLIVFRYVLAGRSRDPPRHGHLAHFAHYEFILDGNFQFFMLQILYSMLEAGCLT